MAMLRMFHHPVLIIVFLLGVEVLVLYAGRRKSLSKFFDIISPIFWIYFLPMLASTFGIIDSRAPVLGFHHEKYFARMSSAAPDDRRSAGHYAVGRAGAGHVLYRQSGVIIGTIFSFLLFKGSVGDQFWGGFGALSASWTGGSANMIAVKEALSVPDAVFSPMVVVDTVVPYLWMGILIAGVRWQGVFDIWNRSDQGMIKGSPWPGRAQEDAGRAFPSWNDDRAAGRRVSGKCGVSGRRALHADGR